MWTRERGANEATHFTPVGADVQFLAAGLLGQQLGVVGDDGLAREREVHDDLRAQGLGQGDLALDPPLRRNVGQRRVLHVLAANAQRHVLADIGLQRRAGVETDSGISRFDPPTSSSSPSAPCLTLAITRFIGGEPTNCATKMLFGVS